MEFIVGQSFRIKSQKKAKMFSAGFGSNLQKILG